MCFFFFFIWDKICANKNRARDERVRLRRSPPSLDRWHSAAVSLVLGDVQGRTAGAWPCLGDIDGVGAPLADSSWRVARACGLLSLPRGAVAGRLSVGSAWAAALAAVLGLFVIDQDAVLLGPSLADLVLVCLQHPCNARVISPRPCSPAIGRLSQKGVLLVRSRKSSSSPLFSFAEVS